MNTTWMVCLMSLRMSIEGNRIDLIKPDWPAANNIHAFSTTRNSGVSEGAYTSLNLAMHVADTPSHVQANRESLKSQLELPTEPLWLNQVHGYNVVDASLEYTTAPESDASFCNKPGKVCSVMTADCLPVLICNRQGNKVAAAHAGWRGLADGVIESTIAAMEEKHSELLVWLGPAIGPQAFEVGEEVRDVFVNSLPMSADAFQQNRQGRYLADIYLLARLRLRNMGVNCVFGGDYCTYTDAQRFYSYRRDDTTGRQASLIWFDE